MKASYHWLASLIAPSGLSLTREQTATMLTDAGLEVEAVETYGAACTSVHVAEVVRVEPHPKREKLRLVTVDTGSGRACVVCGAPNVPAPGGLVVLAVTGTELPAVGLTLVPRQIGGIESQGMLCSERELGLCGASGNDDPGILVLSPGTAKPGTPLSEAIAGTHDTIFDIGLTPNRPDGLGHIGLARELCALSGKSFKHPTATAPTWAGKYEVAPHTTFEPAFEGGAHQAPVEIHVDDVERCPHYGAAMVVGVKVGPSPSWLRYRLESLGIRSISNVVDITNHVLLELGHPIHAFDLSFVKGRRIVVRRAKEGEKLVTLDDVERTLQEDDLVIADGEAAVALAGVMGGAGSEIRSTTDSVLIECAYFAPRGVRRSGRRHGLHTESSHRFERGVDSGDIDTVLERTKSMLVELAGGQSAKTNVIAGVALVEPEAITLRERRMNELLGIRISLDEAARTLEGLGCTVVATGEGAAAALRITPPTHRPDLGIEVDLIEEVVRVRGMDTVPMVLPAIRPQPPRTEHIQRRRVRTAALEVGLSEAVTFAFVSRNELAALGAPEPVVTLKNPLTEERSVMRTSLLPGLLDALRRARRHGVADVRLFTMGARFLARGSDGAEADRELPLEASSFAAVLAGSRGSRLHKPEEVDVYDAKGVAVEIVERATRRHATVEHQSGDKRAAHLHPRGAANIMIEGKVVGQLGPLHPKVVDALDLGGPCLVIEIDLGAMEQVGQATPHFVPIPVLPAATRDVALVVHDDVDAGEVEQAIRSAAEELCESVELFDLFRGGSIAADHRSLAFHVVYRDPLASTKPEAARTLTDVEVDARHAKVVEAVQQRFGATLRA